MNNTSKSTRYAQSCSGEWCKPFIDQLFESAPGVTFNVTQITGQLLKQPGFNTKMLDMDRSQRDLLQHVNDIMRHGMNKRGWNYRVVEGAGPSTIWQAT